MSQPKQKRKMRLVVRQDTNHTNRQLAEAKKTEANGWVWFLVVVAVIAAAIAFN